MIPMSYEESDDDDEVKMVTAINQNNNNDCYVVSDFKSNDKAEENLFDEDIDNEVEATPKTTRPLSMQKWHKP